jgi:DNA recombination protein RmuC
MDYVALILGLGIGLLIGFLIAKLFLTKNSGLTQQLNETYSEKVRLEERVRNTDEFITKAQEQLIAAQGKIEKLTQGLASSEANNETLINKLEEQKSDLTDLQTKFTNEFKVLADKILKENTQEFLQTNNKNIGEILSPLKEKIAGFEKKVEETYINETKDRAQLFEQIKTLSSLNEAMRTDAKNLTRALKGDNKQQGNWGEFILEKILEGSGLQKGQEYQVQGSFTNEEGKRQMPDVIINLPENKHIIIDSKVTLVAYERFVNPMDEEEGEMALKQHSDAVKKHIIDLSGKNYQSLHQINPPDFVLLFMPIESAFVAAIQADRGLFNFAWDRKIVIVSPSTLMATLRTIDSTWKVERQNLNAVEIARQGAGLYDKFVGFIQDLEKIKKGMDTSNRAYDEALNKLSTGRGNLIQRAENLKELGVKTEKKIDESLITKNIE